ncbi:hypothetical protein LR090_05285 [Candidatus Bipolaricaulota bacterium]|nr:hypothetical protein [Candidatus Bipolaricaulota bacterium]
MRVVGIDGGATSTKCLVVNEVGRVLGWGQGGPANHLAGELGMRRLRTAIEQVVGLSFPGELCPRVDSVCMGKTGFREQEVGLVRSIIRETLYSDHILVTGDMQIALAGAAWGQPGVLVYAGTGANTYGTDETGREVWVGGWGYLIDDEGGGYDIGRQALKQAFRALDGRSIPTLLQEKLQRHFGCSSMAELLERVYQDDGLSRPEVAALARLVHQAAQEGDTVAQDILARAGRALAQAAITALRRLGKLDQPFTVYPAGGVFRAGHWILDPLVEDIRQQAPLAEVKLPQFPSVVGAVLFAIRQLGMPVDEPFLENLKRDLKEIQWAN